MTSGYLQVRFAAAKALFDTLAGLGYSRVAKEHGYGAAYDWIREQCGTCKGRRLAVLDVGCADGQIGAVLSGEGILDHIVGIDFSEAMLERCRASGRYAELLQGDLNYGLPSTGGRWFDLAVVCGVFEFVEDAARILRELRGVLVPGGELWATFEVPIDGTRPELPPSEWKFGRTRDEAVALVQGAGYSVVSAEVRVAYQAVTGTGIDVDFVFIRAVSASSAP